MKKAHCKTELLEQLKFSTLSGDILNIALDAIHAGSGDADPAKWRITQEMLEREIEKARAARAEHEGKAKRERRVIGFGQA